MKYYLCTNFKINDRDKERFGVNYFINRGIKVIILDVSFYTNPELNNEKSHYINSQNLTIFECSDFTEVKFALKDANVDDIAFLILGNKYRDIRVKRFLASSQLKIGIDRVSMLPSIKSPKMKIWYKLQKAYNLGIMKSIYYFLNLIYSKFFDVKYYDFMITSNYEFAKLNYNDPPVKKVVLAHNRDYDLYTSIDDRERIIEEKYVLFIDQYLAYHPNFTTVGLQHINKKNYFNALNTLFDNIEKAYGINVVIALHPRANEEYKHEFKNRSTYVNQTCNLVKDSQFVIMHFSTAVNFAVLYHKQIIFVYENELKKNGLSIVVKTFAKELGCDSYNISSISSLPDLNNCNFDKYASYKNRYIKMDGSRNSKYWDIFYEELILNETL